MKAIKSFAALMCALVLMLTACTGGGSSNSATPAPTKDTTATDSTTTTPDPTAEPETQEEEAPAAINPADVTGTISYCFPTWGDLEADEKAQLELFRQKYPNITVNVSAYVGWEGLTQYLTTAAAAGQLPDVVQGWDSLGFFISQGWISPISDMLEKDDEAQYVPKALWDSFSYGGKVYAAPWGTVHNAIIVNLDMLESMNEDPPAYDWTIDEFMRLAKKATTDTTSGLTHTWNLWNTFATTSSDKLWMDVYNPETHTFDYTSGAFEKGINYVKELKSIKGLISDEMKDATLTDNGMMDDYQKKFGKDADALREGKVLFHIDGTWERGGWHSTLPFNWDYYPYPQMPGVGYRNPVHANYAFITTAVKDENRQAAFELMKYKSYGKEGTIDSIEVAINTPNENITHDAVGFPSSTHPDIIAKLKEAKNTLPGQWFMHENMGNAPRGDTNKITVDIAALVNPHLEPILQDLVTGKINPSAVAKDLEDKVNAEFKVQWAELEAKFK